MKLSTIDEMIEILQAKKDGKTLEYYMGGSWLESKNKVPSFHVSRYRVKREPLVVWTNVYNANLSTYRSDSTAAHYFYDNYGLAKAGCPPGGKTIKMVEELDG